MKNTKLINLQNISKSAFAGLAWFALLGIVIGTNACSTNVEENKNQPKDTNSAGIKTVTTTPEAEKSETPETEPTGEVKKDEPKTEKKTNEKKDEKKDEKKVDDGVSKLKKEMPYANARKILINSGWKPVKNTLKEEGRFGAVKYMIEKLKYTEVEDCSGTGVGYCKFIFQDVNGKKLAVVTVNNEEGIDGGPTVNNWSFE